MSSSNQNHPDLGQIIAELDRTTPIEPSAVRRWMATNDIEAARCPDGVALELKGRQQNQSAFTSRRVFRVCSRLL